MATDVQARWQEDDSGWMSLKFGEAARPEGAWEPMGEPIHVAGLHHHRAGVDEFFRAAAAGELAPAPLDLVRQANHPYEPHAVVVYGMIQQVRRKGVFRRPTTHEQRVQLGFLPRDVSALIDAWPTGVHLAAQMVSCAWLPGEPDSRAISLIVLTPPKSDSAWGGAAVRQMAGAGG